MPPLVGDEPAESMIREEGLSPDQVCRDNLMVAEADQ